MSDIRIQSVGSPFDDPEIARLGVSVVIRADAMGLLAPRAIRRLDMAEWQRVVRDVVGGGVGKGILAERSGATPPEANGLQNTLRRVIEALDASPVPGSELPAVQRVLGADLVARLLNVSPVSVRRYSSGAGAVPDDVAARLHALALMVGDLAGAYNEAGIRRWFTRPRTALGNRAPAEVLTSGWQPDGAEPRQVRALALALTASPAT